MWYPMMLGAYAWDANSDSRKNPDTGWRPDMGAKPANIVAINNAYMDHPSHFDYETTKLRTQAEKDLWESRIGILRSYPPNYTLIPGTTFRAILPPGTLEVIGYNGPDGYCFYDDDIRINGKACLDPKDPRSAQLMQFLLLEDQRYADIQQKRENLINNFSAFVQQVEISKRQKYFTLPIEQKRLAYFPYFANVPLNLSLNKVTAEVKEGVNPREFFYTFQDAPLGLPFDNQQEGYFRSIFKISDEVPLPNILDNGFKSLIGGIAFGGPTATNYYNADIGLIPTSVENLLKVMYWSAHLALQGYMNFKNPFISEWQPLGSFFKSRYVYYGMPYVFYKAVRNSIDKFFTDREKEYLDAMYEIYQWIMENGELPGEVKVPNGWISDDLLDNTTTLRNPILKSYDDAANQIEEILVEEIVEIPVDLSAKTTAFLEDLQKQPGGVEAWAQSRAPDIEAVKENISKYENVDPDKVIDEAIQARKELAEAKIEEDKKIADAEAQLVKTNAALAAKREEVAKSIDKTPLTPQEKSQLGVIFYDPYARRRMIRRMRATQYYNGLSGVIGQEFGYYTSLGFSVSSVLKDLEKAIRGALKRGFSSVADEIKRSIKRVNEEIQRSAIAKEIKRVEKRVRKEVFRFTARVVQVAPFLKLLAPILGFIIPGIGPVLALLLSAGVAAAEIGYAYRMKIELKKAAKDALNKILADIAASEAELKKLEELAKLLEAKRKTIAALAAQESAKRKELTAKLFETEETRSKRVLYAAALGASALLPFIAFKKPGIFSYLYLAGVGAGAFYLLKDNREIPAGIKQYQECITYAPEDLCREQYLQESLKQALPELAQLPQLQLEARQLLDQVKARL